MASKGARSKLDHETRARRKKALEAPREPRKPKVHWDHVLGEMVWLAKEFESERKWKLSMAKKIAQRANMGIVDQATKDEKKQKEGEYRLRKVALNISKDVKKFWTKIEKLVLYKNQLEVEERKKKALDKQLDFLLGQTERYSTMLAENLVDVPHLQTQENGPLQTNLPSQEEVAEPSQTNQPSLEEVADPLQTNQPFHEEVAEENTNALMHDDLDKMEIDDDYNSSLNEEPEDDEHTIDEDEAQITEAERNEELAALQAEADLPLDDILKLYAKTKVSRESSPDSKDTFSKSDLKNLMKDPSNQANGCNHESGGTSSDEGNSSEEVDDSYSYTEFVKKNHGKSNGSISSVGEQGDKDYVAADEGKDDEATLSEEEELAKGDSPDPLDEIKLLQKESEIPLEELLARYQMDGYADGVTTELENSPTHYNEEVNTDMSLDGQSVDILKLNNDMLENHEITDMLERKLVSGNALQPEIVPESSVQGCSVKEDELTDAKVANEETGDSVIDDAAAAARSAQPTGNTFSTTSVRTKFPFLLKHSLREYQHIGLDWLVAMYEKRLNGILADEMGLGKTIMTISLLAHLACEKGIWGPHLIVVPTSVMLNWETEFLKWCPAFKILTYFGSAKERKQKRQGWMKPNFFHVCITTYRLVIQDSKAFKRKKWKYLILDEAHLIKNWKSQRWQTLLNFNSKRRILLTGTPLQNDLMELWSLMHFLMPHVFQSHQEFKDWFCNPISGMVEGQDKVNKEVIDRLHNVLRPFILRRLKRDVEKQLPQKHEHVIYCRLSRRQRNLYEDFIANSETQATLTSGNYFGMISIIMQLRKVCNHPDLFEGRPIISSFDMAGINMQISSSVCMVLDKGPFSQADLSDMNLVFTQNEFNMTSWEVDEVADAFSPGITSRGSGAEFSCSNKDGQRGIGKNIFEEIQKALQEERMKEAKERAASIAWWNRIRCQKRPVYGTNIRELLTIRHPICDVLEKKSNPLCHMEFSSSLADLVLSSVERFNKMLGFIESFTFAIPAARAATPICWCKKRKSPVLLEPAYREQCMNEFSPILSPIRPAIVRRQVYFPDRRLIQFDCGKLQELAILLRRLKSEGHRALIFTQMTKMLDTLEEFINLYGYTYLRLDGSTQPEERQTLMQRFNTNPKYFLFILSTRSGGVGVNLVGADTVIFYDSDWNPAMDQQAQDRCHRIGQTREVNIYRLISESTIEENILKKANQKRALDDLVIQRGSYNTEFFKKLDPMEFFSGHAPLNVEDQQKDRSMPSVVSNETGLALSNADVEAAIRQAEDEADYMALKRLEQEEAADNQEFSEEAAGRLEDDELVNEEAKPDEHCSAEHKHQCSDVDNDKSVALPVNQLDEEKALRLAAGDGDMDMLADVKQMAAAAAAAGQASSSFENQLRPIDRYAMRFLELWDPIIDKAAVNYQANVVEEEWELERIEKLKEDLEAEIDEDQEPLSYETWDVDFATTAYRQHVEALAKKQLLEEQEKQACKAAKELEETNDIISSHRKKSKKNKRKAGKFKSLKRGRLSSESEAMLDETSVDTMSIDGNAPSPELISDESPHHCSHKRKKMVSRNEEVNSSSRSLKKFKKAPKSNCISESSSHKHLLEGKQLKLMDEVNFSDPKLVSIRSDGRISTPCMPVKRVMVIKPERLKRKGLIWPRDCVPDSWTNEEDAVLCGTVHEYGPVWELASEFLHSIPGGAFYRGRYRHPVHCCERFRELICKHVLSAMDNTNSEKVPSGTGKAILKVSEDQTQMLLNAISEIPNNELLLQKHFMAILSSVWRSKCGHEPRRVTSTCSSALNKPVRLNEKWSMTNYRPTSNLIKTALADAQAQCPRAVLPRNQESGRNYLELVLDFRTDQHAYEADFPSVVNVSILEPEPVKRAIVQVDQSLLSGLSHRNAEKRFRIASEACFDGEGSHWASSAFHVYDAARHKSGPKSVGKHKTSSESGRPAKSKIQRTTEPQDVPTAMNDFLRAPGQLLASAAEFHIAQSLSDFGINDSEFTCFHDLPLETDTEFAPCQYELASLPGIEELDPLSDFTDIG
ncbi:protein PHOTOPERIOD-INDEPENDENT EARLY FLOWERING 1 isoform X3 [Brachypodium distachyon]|uniref:protein PHOTOPERIOD-INDEPENDENT EARLY FLOWERING 1 isoform X3 n=1 Tax=Brachypodium distachyon TaxID=15368 RepID=UPI00071DCFB1|nr:protein PHOTOPERIOD-INDEPENDENT EARLY FLOWERING 1 isoform X3 [Brachypodium distachyon]|eukprot:XP_014752353.1 protein PHOTOPERIOD-INDEPENDENT EARLY FLOWERING 1 isoform X3 [Brachypodium distachyon]